MRSTASGLEIPAGLAEAVKAQAVVPFAGAGISITAGMPSFNELGFEVFKILAQGTDASFAGRLPWLLENSKQQYFTALKKLFNVDGAALGNAVTQVMENRDLCSPEPNCHDILASLGQKGDSTFFAVTTNFEDLLRSRTGYPATKIYSNGEVAQLVGQSNPSGIAHIHGTLADRPTLTLDDWGKAYMKTGCWVPDFMEWLCSEHTVAFIGYSGNDIPMQYLLSSLDTSNCYAFYGNNPDKPFISESTKNLWADLDIEPVSYPVEPDDNDKPECHDSLWHGLTELVQSEST